MITLASLAAGGIALLATDGLRMIFMTELTYSVRLALTLAQGLAGVDPDLRGRQLRYLAGLRRDDGGYPGREGESDLYYTGFALRSLALLDGLTAEHCERSAKYLRAALRQKTSVVDFFSWLYSASLVQLAGGPDLVRESSAGWEDRIAAELAAFRTPDGGCAKTPRGSSGSTYHTFLVALCFELIDRPVPEPEQVRGFIESRRREDGGFVEVSAMRRSGTNPTAAAIGTLQVLGGPPMAAERREETAAFLLDRVSPEGGLCANSKIPLADLLSTFTGFWTLRELGGLDRVDRERAIRYVRSLEADGGGFHAGLWDEAADAEYTFYGLGTLALLHLP